MRKHLPLIIGLAIPVIMVLLVIATVYLPSIFIKPESSFIYSTGIRYYDYGDRYSVEAGRVTKKTIPYPNPETEKNARAYQADLKLYKYDAQTDRSTEISYEEAQKYTVDTNIKSPDGFVLDHGQGHNGIFELFGSRRDYNAHYLKKEVVSKKIYLTSNNNDYYNRNIQFLGWITK